MGNRVEGLQPLDVVVGLQELGFALDEGAPLGDRCHRVPARVEPTVVAEDATDRPPRLQQDVTVDHPRRRTYPSRLEPGPETRRVVEESAGVLERRQCLVARCCRPSHRPENSCGHVDGPLHRERRGGAHRAILARRRLGSASMGAWRAPT